MGRAGGQRERGVDAAVGGARPVGQVRGIISLVLPKVGPVESEAAGVGRIYGIERAVNGAGGRMNHVDYARAIVVAI